MTPESYLLAFFTLLVGTLIGYFKARADFAEKLGNVLTKDDCAVCQTKADLKKGVDRFAKIETSLAVIKVHLGIRDDLDELRKAIDRLEEN